MRLLTDKSFRRLMAIAEDDLIHDFVRARLSDREMKAFRANYLTTPERLQRVRFATALDNYYSMNRASAAPDAARRPGRLRWSAVTVTVCALLLIAAAIAVFRIYRFKRDEFKTELIRLNQNNDLSTLAELKGTSPLIVALTLKQNLVREGPDFRVANTTPEVQIIRLWLEVSGQPYSSFEAIIQSDSSAQIGTLTNLKSRGDGNAHFVVVNVPARLLTPGTYELRLVGISADGQSANVGLYPFQIVERPN